MNFREEVIAVVYKIPYGRVTTYGTIAALAGKPRAARIVGGILCASEGKVDLPWQRIINRQGHISVKCMEHSKPLQKALLEQEGVEVSEDFVVDLQKYGWWGEN